MQGFRAITQRLQYVEYENISHGRFSNQAKDSQVFFNPFNSPYSFRNYLTYGVGLQPTEWQDVDHPFYVNEILEVNGEFSPNDLSSPNFGVVHSEKPESATGVLSIILLTGILILMINV